jgi:hypothetical protein
VHLPDNKPNDYSGGGPPVLEDTCEQLVFNGVVACGRDSLCNFAKQRFARFLELLFKLETAVLNKFKND